MKKLNELEVFTYLNCSQLYYYSKDKNIKLATELLIAKDLVAEISKKHDIDLFQTYLDISKNYFKEENKKIFLYPKIERLINNLRLWYLSPSNLSLKKNIKLKHISINIDIPNLYFTKKGALRGFVYSPLIFKKDTDWNLIHRLQYSCLKELYNDIGYVAGQPAKLYIIGYGKNGYRLNSINKDIKEDCWKNYLDTIDNLIYKNYHWPLNNCLNFNCEFRSKCYPGAI